MTIGLRVRRYPVGPQAHSQAHSQAHHQAHSLGIQNAQRRLADFRQQALSGLAAMDAGAQPFAPTLRAVENQTDYVVSAEVPGVAPEDLSVVVEEGILTLRGVRKSLDWSEDLPDDEKEALLSRFERTVRFNGEIDEERVTARSKNGLLQIVVPKPEPPVAQATTIPVQAG